MTSNSNRRSKYDTDFGALVSSALAEARMTQSELASFTGQSKAYTNQVITGHKAAPKNWVELVAEHLNMKPDKKRELLELANERRKRSKFTLPPYKG